MKNTFLQRLFLLCLLILLGFYASIAQVNWKVEWGNNYKNSKKEGDVIKVITSDENGFYVLRCVACSSGFKHWNGLNATEKQSAWIDYYNFNFEIQKSVPIKLTYEKAELHFEGIIDLGKQAYVVTSFFNRKHKKSYLFAQELDFTSLSISSEYTKLSEVAVPNNYKSFSYIIKHSADSTKMLIASYLVMKVEPYYTMAVWDEGMVKLWEKSEQLPYSKMTSVVKEFSVDNNANVYITVERTRLNREKTIGQEHNKDYHVFAWLKRGEVFKEFKVALNDKYISGFTMVELGNGELACAGLYSNEKERYTKGAFYYRLDPETGLESHKKLHPFSIELRSGDLSERQQEKILKKDQEKQDELELDLLKVNNLFIRPDGNLILVSEQISNILRGETKSKTWFDVGNIILVNFTPDGELLWSSLLKKDQISLFGGYALLGIGSNMYFLYKSDEKGESIKMASVSHDGKIAYNDILPYEDYYLDIFLTELVNAQLVIIHVSSIKNAQRFGKIIFQ